MTNAAVVISTLNPFLLWFRPTDNSLESVKQKLELLHMNSLEEKFNDQTRSPQDPPRMHLVLQVRKCSLWQCVVGPDQAFQVNPVPDTDSVPDADRDPGFFL
jgi:hypothetical protein